MADDDPVEVKAGWFVHDQKGPLTTALGAIALALAASIDGNWGLFSRTLVIFVGGAAATVVGLYWTYTRSKEIDTLTSEVRRLSGLLSESEEAERNAKRDLEGTIDLFLANLATRCVLTFTDRVSVFAFDGEAAFYCLGRYSIQPNHRRGGRPVYPANEGYLGAAWAGGDEGIWVDGLPDPETEKAAYDQAHLDGGLAADEIKDLSMASRAYFGVPVCAPGGHERAGVLMFESTSPEGLEHLRGRDLAPELVSLGGLIVMGAPKESPSLDTARRSGL